MSLKHCPQGNRSPQDTLSDKKIPKENITDARDLLRKTRHKAELPLNRACICLSCLFYVLFFILAAHAEYSVYERNMLREMLVKEGISEVITSSLEEIGTLVVLVVVILYVISIIYDAFAQYGRVISNSVRATENNFPEIFKKAQEYAAALGMSEMPEVYVGKKTDKLDVMSAYVPGKNYIRLDADLIGVTYVLENVSDAVYFSLAREFGHLYFHHRSLWFNLVSFPSRLIPVFGAALLRAQTYSADRAAQILTGGKGADQLIIMEYCNFRMIDRIDTEDYLKMAATAHTPAEKFARFMVNMFSNRPTAPYRIAAIKDPEMKSGRLF